jgi:hypothetical protein
MSTFRIRAQIRTDQPEKYEPTHPAGYFYMFTGGYGYRNGKLSRRPFGADEGPAGEILIDTEKGSWEIEVKDHTREKFRIVRWTLLEANLPGLSYDPEPDADLEPARKLTIRVSNMPTGHHERFDVYTLTLVNGKGKRVTLDPRIYDIR